MNQDKEKISCDVFKDLVPLYIHRVCSEHSEKLVEQHIENCDECRSTLSLLKENWGQHTIQSFNDDKYDSKIIKGLAKAWKATKVKAWLKGMFVTMISFGLVIFVYIGLTQWNIVPVTVSDVYSIDVYKLGL